MPWSQIWQRLLGVSSAIQHVQLWLQGLSLFVGVSALVGILGGAVLAIGAAVADQPWYWIVSLFMSFFAAVLWSAASIKQLVLGSTTPSLPPQIVEASRPDEANVTIQSEGYTWKRGLYERGTRSTFPICAKHGTRLLFKYNDSHEWNRETWRTEELEDLHSPKVHGHNLSDGHLVCPEGGHDLPWFTESKTFKEARIRADMLIKRALERRQQPKS